jgi:hypothetical protein
MASLVPEMEVSFTVEIRGCIANGRRKLVWQQASTSTRCAAGDASVSIVPMFFRLFDSKVFCMDAWIRHACADCWSTWGPEVGMVGVQMHLPPGGARSDRIALCACGKLSRSAARHLTLGQ